MSDPKVLCRLLIRNARLLIMDHVTGDLDTGDLLIEGSRITAVGVRLDAAEAEEIVDATGCIVIPGLIDTHRHMWQALLRGCAPRHTLGDYFRHAEHTDAHLAGVETLGLDHRIGSLTPGKQADLIILRADRPDVAPVHDPYSTVPADDVDSIIPSRAPRAGFVASLCQVTTGPPGRSPKRGARWSAPSQGAFTSG